MAWGRRKVGSLIINPSKQIRFVFFVSSLSILSLGLSFLLFFAAFSNILETDVIRACLGNEGFEILSSDLRLFYVMIGLITTVTFLGNIYIGVKLSHTILGPYPKMSTFVRSLTAGEKVDPLSLRKNDWLRDLALDLNALAEKHGQLNKKD